MTAQRVYGLSCSIAIGVYIRPKSLLLVNLAFVIILSIYTALDLTYVASTISLKIVYSSHTNLDNAGFTARLGARLSYNITTGAHIWPKFDRL